MNIKENRLSRFRFKDKDIIRAQIAENISVVKHLFLIIIDDADIHSQINQNVVENNI